MAGRTLNEKRPRSHKGRFLSLVAKYLSVRCMPKEFQATVFSVYIGENRRSEFMFQSPRCALNRRSGFKPIRQESADNNPRLLAMG
jgi:hypothetical protein